MLDNIWTEYLKERLAERRASHLLHRQCWWRAGPTLHVQYPNLRNMPWPPTVKFTRASTCNFGLLKVWSIALPRARRHKYVLRARGSLRQNESPVLHSAILGLYVSLKSKNMSKLCIFLPYFAGNPHEHIEAKPLILMSNSRKMVF